MAARSLLTKTTKLSLLAPTADAMLGTERLLLTESRDALRGSYQALFEKAEKNSIVATNLNTSISFLDGLGFFKDLSRPNDISHYTAGRGKKGTDTKTGEDYAWEMQNRGFPICIPRELVSHGEKQLFVGLLLQQAVEAALAAKASSNSDALVGCSVYMENDQRGNVEHQMLWAAKKSPQCFVVNGVDTAEQKDVLKEILQRNMPVAKRLGSRDTTGVYVEDEADTTVGFDIPALLVKGGEIVDVL